MADTSRDPANMTTQELHTHFPELLVGRVEDVDARLEEFNSKLTNVMDKIEGLEKSFNDKLDARFKEVLDRLPAPTPVPVTPRQGARCIPITIRTTGSTAADAPQTSNMTAAATLGEDNRYYYDFDDDDLFD